MKYKQKLLMLFLILSTMFEPTVLNAQSYQQNGSWAIGLVLPNNFMLSNGQKLQWNRVNNITVILKLPQIQMTDRTIMCVESLMVGNGTIIQVSVSLYQNSTYWTVCGMYIPSPESYPQEYVIQQHFGTITAGSLVSISLNRTQEGWAYSVYDYNSSELFLSKLPVYGPPVSGPQYVIAFESYSYNSSVFEKMGRASFYALFANGQRIVKGPEVYMSWSESITPLFIVGGQNPPSFISIYSENGSYIITYVNNWAEYRSSPFGYYYILIFGISAAALINVTYLVIAIKRLRKNVLKAKAHNYYPKAFSSHLKAF